MSIDTNFSLGISSMKQIDELAGEHRATMDRVVRCIATERVAAKEAYITRYIQATGEAIEDLELVMYTDSKGPTFNEVCFLRRRGSA